ncbi:MAG: protease modulator HflC [Caulobacter sp.]|nr:protease modulator HflC [Caulobacter sp.]
MMTNRNKLTILAIFVGGLLLLASQTFYVIGQTEQAVIVQLGKVVRVVNAPGRGDGPGLKVKIPLSESVIRFDKRNQMLEATQEEILTGNKERLMVDAFLRYRVKNPYLFYTALGDGTNGQRRLEQRLNAALRQALGTADSEDIISTRRSELMGVIRNNLARQAASSRLGIEVIDVRIKRADLPLANQNAVYERMKTARQQQSTRIRAEGDQKALEILGTATGEAERIRGEADAERARLFAESFGKDPAFAGFYRSMRAYETSLGQGDATLVLSPDSEFFRYFGRGGGE